MDRDLETSSYFLTLPLFFRGVYLGDAPVVVSDAGVLGVDRDRFIALLGPQLSPELVARLQAQATQDLLSAEMLSAVGVTVAYDSATLELEVIVPTDQWGEIRIPISNQRFGAPSADAVEAASFSFSVTVSGQQSYDWDEGAEQRPFRGSADVSANLFGLNGLYLFGEVEYDGAREQPLQRGNVLLVKDDQDRALRYQLGDFAPNRVGFQSAPSLGGIAIGTQYQELQPFRNIRPSGRYRFVVEQSTVVDVLVNGVSVRTLRLDPGAYDLRDFPFFNGLNEVQLYAIDPSGRRLLATFSQFSGTQLLGAGVMDFAVAAGVKQDRDAAGELVYDTETPIFSAFVRRGLTDALTAGANVQYSNDLTLVGADAGFASPVGVIGFDIAYSQHAIEGAGTAARVAYESSSEGVVGLDRVQLNLEYEWYSDEFVTFEGPDARSFETQARAAVYGQSSRFGFGVSASHAQGRPGEINQTRFAASVSTSLGRGRLTVSADRLDEGAFEPEDSVLVTFSVPLGRRQTVRLGHDTDEGRSFLEYSRFRTRDLGDFGVDVSLETREAETRVQASALYNANRFAVELQHDAVMDEAAGDEASQETSLILGSQLVYADGRIAVGRPVGPSFVVFDRHSSLDGAAANVRRGVRSGRLESRVGSLGPALAAVGAPYSPVTLYVDVEDLPEGYDPGPGAYEVFPGPATGHVITIGSDANRILSGALLLPNGEPAALLGGDIRSIARPDELIQYVFTNAAGRFVVTGLAPGRYRITLGEDRTIVLEVEIPEDGDRTVELGSVSATIRE